MRLHPEWIEAYLKDPRLGEVVVGFHPDLFEVISIRHHLQQDASDTPYIACAQHTYMGVI